MNRCDWCGTDNLHDGSAFCDPCADERERMIEERGEEWAS